jgi:acyl-CoA thioesterase-1
MLRILFLVLAVVFATMGAGLAHAGPAILVYGDSLSAAYGIARKDGWVSLLEDRLREKHLDYTVVNASISGETSSGGASRIAAALIQHKPRVLILALGANDGLRGLPVAQMRENLSAIIRAAQKAGARVLLVGMKMPPNYGQQYTREFEQVYGTLVKQYRVSLAPFLLEGIAGTREMFLDDNLHPTAKAQPIVLETVWRGLAPLLH